MGSTEKKKEPDQSAGQPKHPKRTKTLADFLNEDRTEEQKKAAKRFMEEMIKVRYYKDSEVLDAVPGLEKNILVLFRKILREELAILDHKERLTDRDLTPLKKIVEIQSQNTTMYATTIVRKVTRAFYGESEGEFVQRIDDIMEAEEGKANVRFCELAANLGDEKTGSSMINQIGLIADALGKIGGDKYRKHLNQTFDFIVECIAADSTIQ